ncbi:MAG: mannose-1-phosphate guanylyltransferase [Flavobacteriia bacterium]|nr:mannose-1-phosphate guanylyltransferase [Flavobacteriia bacterium]
MKNTYCVIMAGGVGSRFWPSSTSTKPKQFLDILGTGETLIQQTFRRLSHICPEDHIYVVTNEQYAAITQEQLPNIPNENIILEPARRNTAPCIAYAAFKIKKKDPLANMVISPADHLITDEKEFGRILNVALEATRDNNILCTLGIKPHRPETGYGYIQYKDPEKKLNPEIQQVKTFTEKPNLEMAEQFIESGDFLWNSGIFIWNANTIMNSFDKHLPDIYQSFEQGWDVLNTPEEKEFIDNIYPSCENESVDYGILEKAKNVYVIPSSFGWSDLGSWGSVHEQSKLDENGNSTNTKKVLFYNSRNNIVRLDPGKLGVISGLEDYIIIQDETRLLICPRSEEQGIKQMVNDVKVDFGDLYT